MWISHREVQILFHSPATLQLSCLLVSNSQTLGPDKGDICADQELAFSSPLSKLLRKKKSRGNTNFVKVIPLGLKKKCGVCSSINISKRSLSVTTSKSQFPSWKHTCMFASTPCPAYVCIMGQSKQIKSYPFSSKIVQGGKKCEHTRGNWQQASLIVSLKGEKRRSVSNLM